MSDNVPLNMQLEPPGTLSTPPQSLEGLVQQPTPNLETHAAQLRDLGSQMDTDEPAPQAAPKDTEKADADARSVYIGNVDYDTTPVELQQHFTAAGPVKRVTIMSNKATGQAKGFAYLEFEDAEGAHQAVAALDGSSFRGRELKVSLKRTNIPGVSGRGRGMARGRGRGMLRGRGRGLRGRGFRGAGRFAPY